VGEILANGQELSWIKGKMNIVSSETECPNGNFHLFFLNATHLEYTAETRDEMWQFLA
jgi:hypothetical protein